MATGTGWQESDSKTFIDLGRIYTPARDEIEQTIVDLIPAEQHDAFRAADLCAGEGWLSRRLLERFPQSEVSVLDGSNLMLEQAGQLLAPYAGRFKLRRYRLENVDDLKDVPMHARAVVSSLAIHHLSNVRKQDLYRRLYMRLDKGGALLIADIIAPASDLQREQMANAWDREVRRQSVSFTGRLEAFRRFQREEWNWFRYPDPMDRPAPLLDQLGWLEEVGFESVDVFWLHAGHAVFGGYK